jgi:hypothetical protein
MNFDIRKPTFVSDSLSLLYGIVSQPYTTLSTYTYHRHVLDPSRYPGVDVSGSRLPYHLIQYNISGQFLEVLS